MYQVVELLRKMVDDVEYEELSEADYKRGIIIRDVLYLEDREVEGVQYWIDGVQEAKRKRKGKK